MKNLPKNLENKLNKAALHYGNGIALLGEVEQYLEEKGVNIDSLRAGDGNGLEEIEYGHCHDEMITKINDALEEATEHGKKD